MTMFSRIVQWFFALGERAPRIPRGFRGTIFKPDPPESLPNVCLTEAEKRLRGYVASPPLKSELMGRLYSHHEKVMISASLLRAGIITKNEHQATINRVRAAEGLLPIAQTDD